MAQIDASALAFSFNAFNSATVQFSAFIASTANNYTWRTGSSSPYNIISAISGAGDITTSPSPAGTISAIAITSDTDQSGIGITGLNASLSNLFDTTNATTNQEHFWNTVLAGATTILEPALSGTFDMTGDFIAVHSTLTLTGAKDSFTGTAVTNGSMVSGDAGSVEANATLNGGADTFVDAGQYIFGDVGSSTLGPSNAGTVHGGNDSISVVDTNYNPIIMENLIVGDVFATASGGVDTGGADSITLRNAVNFQGISGDDYIMQGTSHGGNDTILLETTIAGRPMMGGANVAGDDFTLGTGATATGGNDTITLHNVSSGTVDGDFNGDVDAASATGGNDTITVESTFPTTNPPSPPPFLGEISGDAAAQSSGTFKGGDDKITVKDVAVSTVISGDMSQSSGATSFTGGKDTISVTFDRPFTSESYTISGDAANASGLANFTGGDDSITLNTIGMAAGGSLFVTGDAQSVTSAGSGSLHFGNDSIAVSGDAAHGAMIVGDASGVQVGGLVSDHMTVTAGNDSLRGGAGNDTLYGDYAHVVTISGAIVVTQVAGTNTLDGGAGSDTLIGGLGGHDTAVFSLNQSVYVDLTGVGLPSNVNAIGQGNDQLIGIANVTGSAQADTILGDTGGNTLIGMAGNDALYGRDGGDALNGGAGADTMAGGNGNDSYAVDNTGDKIVEAAGATAGIDRVVTAISYALAVNVENLATTSATGTAAINLTGNILGNTITGNAGANVIMGADGADILTGGAGRDTLAGKVGLVPDDGDKDTYVFNAVTDSGATAATRDIIIGHFNGGAAGGDKVDLSAIDADSTLAGNQAFVFDTAIGTATSAVARGHIGWYQEDNAGTASDHTIVKLNIDADSTIESTIQINGLVTLHAADFVL